MSSFTQRPPLEAPPASSQLAHVIHTLYGHQADLSFEKLSPESAELSLEGDTELLFLRWDESQVERLGLVLQLLVLGASSDPLAPAVNLRKGFQQLLRPKPDPSVRRIVGLVGGSENARKALKLAGRGHPTVGLIHIDDQSAIWSRKAKKVPEALSTLDTTPQPSEADWAKLLKIVDADLARNYEARTQDREIEQRREAFLADLSKHRPIALYTLTALSLIFYIGGRILGDFDSLLFLNRMGALDPERVLAGEWWRLLSSALLHLSLLSLLFKLSVLWPFARLVEQFLGTAHFVLIFCLSCLIAGFGVLSSSEGIFLMADAGFLGVLFAYTLLERHLRDLLPIHQRLLMGSWDLAYIAISFVTLGNFFTSHSSYWSLIGGATGSFLVYASGPLLRYIPRLAEQTVAPPPRDPGLQMAGGFMALLFLLSAGLALENGQPWAEERPPDLVSRPLPELGISLHLPRELEKTVLENVEGKQILQVGRFDNDLGAVTVTFSPSNHCKKEALETALQALLYDEIPLNRIGRKLHTAPEERTIAGSPVVTVTFGLTEGVEQQLAFAFLPDGVLTVEYRRPAEFHEAIPESYALEILQGLEHLPPGAPTCP